VAEGHLKWEGNSAGLGAIPQWSPGPGKLSPRSWRDILWKCAILSPFQEWHSNICIHYLQVFNMK